MLSLVHLSVKQLVVTMFPYPLNRTFGIISGSDDGPWPISRLSGTPWDRYSFTPFYYPRQSTHAVTCLLGPTRCCTLVQS